MPPAKIIEAPLPPIETLMQPDYTPQGSWRALPAEGWRLIGEDSSTPGKPVLTRVYEVGDEAAGGGLR